MNVWDNPEVKQLYADIEKLYADIEKRTKENRLEIYNVGLKVHKKQILFHESTKRIKAIFGGNRTGKTVAGAVEAVCRALGHGRFQKIGPSSGWVVSLSGDVQRKVAQAEILRWLPKNEIRPNGILMRHGRKDDPEGSLIEEIRLKNGCFIGFKTCEQGRESFQGTSLGWVWFDEEPPEDVFKECWMRVMDTRGYIWFTMTPLLGLTWVYTLVYLNENNNPNIEYFEFEWEDNPWLSKEEIAEMEMVMSEEEREARQYGRFTSLCGFAFNELRKDIHIKKPEIIPDWYKCYVAMDYGFDSLAVLWIYVDRFGHGRIYRALRKKNLIISEAAKEILKFTGNERIEAFYAPPDLWNRRQDTGKSAAMIFYENGITLMKASNDREQGWLNVHEWLRPYETRDEQTGETYKTANLTFDEGLDPDLWKHLTTIQKSEKNPNDVATQPHECTHYPDALRCFCVSRMIASAEPEGQRHYNFDSERPKSDSGYFGGEVTSNYLNYGG
jgi:phage terminase large subunit-like protein